MYNIFDIYDIFDIDMDVWNDGEEEYYVYFLSWRVYGRNIFFYYRKVCDSWKLIKGWLVYWLFNDWGNNYLLLCLYWKSE